jgi:hypothetical protein
MSDDRVSRFGALSGMLFVVLQLAGFAIATGAGAAAVTLGDSDAKILKAFSDPVGNGVWPGAYLEIMSLAAFAVFVAWLYRAGRAPFATVGLVTAAAYISVTLVSLVIGDVLRYRSGHGLGAQETLALFDVQSGLFAVSWGLAGGVIAFAPVGGWLRRSAFAIAALSLVAMAAPKAGLAQMPTMLFLIWVVAASVALARRPRAAMRVS